LTHERADRGAKTKNDETRMTNDECQTPLPSHSEIRHSSFIIRHSPSSIRHPASSIQP
jgi:hypothetical protein